MKLPESHKSEELRRFLERGFGRSTAIEEEKCAACGKSVAGANWKDDISKIEYSISGLCQSCQDKVFEP